VDNLGYKHLLLAADFEEESEPVVERARRLRDLLGARLSLLHVVEHIPPAVELMPLGLSGESSLPDDLALEEELLGIARRQLGALGDRLGVPESDRLVRVGPVAHLIDETAAEIGADLVVVGGRGHRGLLGLFGSTAKGVLSGLCCDVLCVRLERPDKG
jgi:universal stress protein A